MTWIALIRVLVELFGPLLAKLVEDLLSRAADELEAAKSQPGSPATAIRDVFAAARGQTWAWQIGRRRLLAACERVALARVADVFRAVKGGATPHLSRSDEAAIAEAL